MTSQKDNLTDECDWNEKILNYGRGPRANDNQNQTTNQSTTKDQSKKMLYYM